ncbi:SMI1/KNR4 family protein [Streptomyces sp. NPDC002671]
MERDWEATQQRLGQVLPQDYKDLVDVYGGGEFYGHIDFLSPPPTLPDSELVTFNRGYMDDLFSLWAISDNRKCPAELAVDDLLLVVWAVTIDSDTISWLVRPGVPPEEWPVVVLHADLEDCEIYSMTCTEFLAGLFARDFESEILTYQLNDEEEALSAHSLMGDDGVRTHLFC